ncbi:hypothetical protein AVEN_232982-1, partial [Araneus ventricosus]
RNLTQDPVDYSGLLEIRYFKFNTCFTTDTLRKLERFCNENQRNLVVNKDDVIEDVMQ